MTRYILTRVLGAVLMLVVTSIVVFGIFFIVPRLAGQTTDQLAAQYVAKDPSPEEIAAIKQKLGLDQPVVIQYGRFVKGIVVGREFQFGPDTEYCPPPCFGYSFKTQRPVWPDLVDRLSVTFSLAIGASIIWLVAGVSIGVLSALRRGTFFDRFAMIIALAGVSLPIFFTGLLSLALFKPTGVNYVPFTDSPFEWAYNLLLPWITLAFLYAALYARLTRAGMLETMSQDFIRTARAKGLPERTVTTKHALRATLTPILTLFGLDIGLLLGGAVLTESTFSLPGIGRYAIDAIGNNDLPQVLGVTMLAAFFIVVANLIVDILYAVADPRVRLS
ncbi:MAG TPA: ABC transporter permease [Kribbellaceae bacterium]|nr:ABC transporter permease [Kribbellaceae bacterium]